MSEEKELLQKLYNLAITELFEGKQDTLVIANFISLGIPEVLAKEIVFNANKYKKQESRKIGLKTVGMGIGFILLGFIITGITYSIASSGGIYVVTTGLFLVGGWNVLKGVLKIVSS